jgi:hypothetical protein
MLRDCLSTDICLSHVLPHTIGILDQSFFLSLANAVELGFRVTVSGQRQRQGRLDVTSSSPSSAKFNWFEAIDVDDETREEKRSVNSSIVDIRSERQVVLWTWQRIECRSFVRSIENDVEDGERLFVGQKTRDEQHSKR